MMFGSSFRNNSSDHLGLATYTEADKIKIKRTGILLILPFNHGKGRGNGLVLSFSVVD